MSDTEGGDADASGAEDLAYDDDVYFDDDFLLADPEYEEYKPPKPDVYMSVLDHYRDKERESFVRNLPRVHFSPRVPEECKSRGPDQDETIMEGARGDSPEKRRLSVSQTYKDFLEFKRTIATSERLKEFKGIGRPIKPPSRGFHSFAGELPEFPKRKRAYSFGGEDPDRTLDMDPILKPESLFKEKDDGEACNLETSQKDEDQAKIDYLIEDQYYPGLIDDAVNKKVDFYQVAFDVKYGSDTEVPDAAPEEAPLSLVEAFDLRVALEKGARKKIMKQTPAPKGAQQDMVDQGKSFVTFLKDYQSPTRLINRDEVVFANTVDVELATVVRNKPVNALTRAINCLQKAEIMNDFDKSLQAAEEAYSRAPPELAESAAVQKATTFVADEITKRTATVGGGKSYRPIEIVSYMGITKPVVRESLTESRYSESRLADVSQKTAGDETASTSAPKKATIAKPVIRPPAKPPTRPPAKPPARPPARPPAKSPARAPARSPARPPARSPSRTPASASGLRQTGIDSSRQTGIPSAGEICIPSGRDSAARASGIPARASGIPARASGIPARASGIPARASGIPARASGIPARATGIPARASGIPARASGIPARASGIPARASGIPQRAMSKPRVGARK